MMPVAMAKQGEMNTIKRIGGNSETKQHLADLGFTVGGKVIVISEAAGNLILNIRDTRVAVGRDMAMRIMI